MAFHGDRSHANECVTIVNQSLLYQLNQQPFFNVFIVCIYFRHAVSSVEPPLNNSMSTTPKIKVEATFTDAGSSGSSTTGLVSSTEPAQTTAKTVMSESSAASSPTTAAGKGESTTSTTVKPTEALAAPTTAVPPASITNSSKTTPAVNDHAIRDVSSEKCSVAYNVSQDSLIEVVNNEIIVLLSQAAVKVNWVPEKVTFGVLLEGNAVVTGDQLWYLLKINIINRVNSYVVMVCQQTVGCYQAIGR